MESISTDYSVHYPTDTSLYEALEKLAQSPTSTSISTLSSFSPADRKLIEELAAAALLPNPTITPADYSVLLQKVFENADLVGSISKTNIMGKCENSIILAVLSKWAESVEKLAEEGKEDARKKALDPFSQALKDFSERKEIPGMPGVIDVVQMLRSSPLLLASLKLQNVDAATLAAVYKKAETVVMLDLVSRFQTAGTTISSAIGTATGKPSAINPAMQMFTNYLNEIKSGKCPLNQTILSVMVTGIFAGQNIQAGLFIDPKTNSVSIDPTVSSLLPMNQALQALNTLVPQAIQSSLSGNVTSAMVTIMNSFQRAATFQALTTAFSLMKHSISPHTLEHKPKEVSAKAYAFKLEQMIVSPECETFMRTMFSLNPTLSKLSPEQLQTATTISRALLLTNALAALDKNETGGIVIRKEDIKGFLNGSIQVPPDDMRAALVTLIRKELKDLDPETSANTLQMLLEYIDSNPDVSDLVDPIEDMVTSFDSFLSIKKQTAQEV